MIQTMQLRSCDVHRLLDFDTQDRMCGYCGLCDAWICEEDRYAIGRRVLAAAKRMLEPGFRGDPKYNEIVAQELANTVTKVRE